MNPGATNTRLFHNLNLREITLFDGTNVWEINAEQMEALKAELDSLPIQINRQTLPANVFSWPGKGLVIVLTVSGYGLAFATLEEAERIISILRFHVLTEVEPLWFLALTRQEITDLLESQETILRMPELEMEDEIYTLTNPKSFVKRSSDGGGMWFWQLDYLVRYQEWIKESDDQYQMWAGSI